MWVPLPGLRSLADQGPAATQLTTVAQRVSPGNHAPHAELTTPAMSTFPEQPSTPVNRPCHAVIAHSMSDPALLSVHPDVVPLEQLDELHDLHGKWCVVRYYGNAYPGIVTKVGDR